MQETIKEQVLTNNLSFSSIVDRLQGNKADASYMIYCIAERKETVNRVVAEMEKQLGQLKQEQNILQSAIPVIARHIKMALPLYVKIETGLVICTEQDCVIERNVI